jgi:hypothetical protein
VAVHDNDHPREHGQQPNSQGRKKRFFNRQQNASNLHHGWPVAVAVRGSGSIFITE